ncbi:hypothetical protein Pcinc_042444 [Petrolisthes cinctipes]|uniref:Uncharacterized protein n=1 Tax=Petrolisthes cinctipes TaxID=88211 RepID=A0AAE1BHQ2_PETCI|nr:hypothetical protein Pcinc_042444 [Petrolisthes cinctipes]
MTRVWQVRRPAQVDSHSDLTPPAFAYRLPYFPLSPLTNTASPYLCLTFTCLPSLIILHPASLPLHYLKMALLPSMQSHQFSSVLPLRHCLTNTTSP